MVLGGGDASKPSVSFLNFEPKSQIFPDQNSFCSGLFTTATIIGFGDSVAFEILFVRLASDICSVEKAFCVLFVEFLVNNVLGFFDGVCCCDEHVDTSTV